MDFYFISIMFVLGGWIFMSKYKHMLIMLLSLEVVMLGLYSLLYFWSLLLGKIISGGYDFNNFFSIFSLWSERWAWFISNICTSVW